MKIHVHQLRQIVRQAINEMQAPAVLSDDIFEQAFSTINIDFTATKYDDEYIVSGRGTFIVDGVAVPIIVDYTDNVTIDDSRKFELVETPADMQYDEITPEMERAYVEGFQKIDWSPVLIALENNLSTQWRLEREKVLQAVEPDTHEFGINGVEKW